MANRREVLLDAAIDVLGTGGMRALTHRAVDAAAAVAVGSTANYFASRAALLEAIAERVAAREHTYADELATTAAPRNPAELGQVLARFAVAAAGNHRAVTLSRYAILVEAGTNPAIRKVLAATGRRVDTWSRNWLRLIRPRDLDAAHHICANYVTGLVLHQLAMPDPAFDPTDRITALLQSL